MSNETREVLRICEQLPQAQRRQVAAYARSLLPAGSGARGKAAGRDEPATAVTVTLPRDERPVWERIASMAAALPAEAVAGLPADGASRLDHYLYGAPKRAE